MAAVRRAAILFALAAAAAAAGTSSPVAARSDSPRHPARRPTPVGKALDRAGSPAGRWVGETISLDLKDADLRDVLHAFSQMTGLNIAVDPEVKGSVTVRLHDVPWDQALDLIVRANGFGYVLEGNVLRVGLPSKL